MNKIMLESHGNTIDNDTIAALRLVKDFIRKEGGIDKFLITRKLLNYSYKSLCKVLGVSRIKEEGRWKRKKSQIAEKIWFNC